MVGTFWILAVLMVCSALLVVISSRILYSTVALICHLIAVAGLFALLDAQFVAVVQLLVYASAIIILILFAVFLLRTKVEPFQREEYLFVLSAIIAGVFILFLTLPVGASLLGDLQVAENLVIGEVLSIGQSLFSRHVVSFVLVAFLMIAALVTVVMLGQLPCNQGREKEGDSDF